MADLPTAIARLIAELTKPADAGFSPKQALEGLWDALEQLDASPSTAQELRNQIAAARSAGRTALDGTPLYLLEAMLQQHSDEGGQRHD